MLIKVAQSCANLLKVYQNPLYPSKLQNLHKMKWKRYRNEQFLQRETNGKSWRNWRRKERSNGSKLLKIVKKCVFYKIIVWRKLCFFKFRFFTGGHQYIVPLKEEEFWKNMQNSGSYDFLKNSIEMLGSYILLDLDI